MNLEEYVRREGRGVIARLSRVSGLSYSTVLRAAQGRMRLTRHATLRSLSAATEGQVSIEDLAGSPAEPISSTDPSPR